MYFIDLFAGLGGFHLALESLGHECVFASEIKDDLQKLYRINFPNTPVYGDITLIAPENIPPHDVICAGFPCQPFSQAGKREGFNDANGRGNLFDYICAIAAYHRPRYIFLENVSNLKGHDGGRTWETIKNRLEELRYEVKEKILSPHQFGIPQHRRRIYIVCENRDFGRLEDFSFPEENQIPCDIKKIIDPTDTNIIKLKQDTRQQIKVWQEFIDLTIKHGDKIPSFPIWAMEFGATYEYETIAPAYQTVENLRDKKGKLGKTIIGSDMEKCLSCLPVYAQTDKSKVFPKWKISYIKQNREFYEKHKKWLKVWMEKIKYFDNSHQKMEWNCGKDPNATPFIEDKIVQFRASGIRIKLPTFSPALNLVGTQIPILPWVELPKSVLVDGEPNKGRYMTRKEAATLQGMKNLKFGNDEFTLTPTRSFEALGNAVNATIVRHIARNLIEE